MGFNRAMFNVALAGVSDSFIENKYAQVSNIIIDAFKNTDKDIATSRYLIHIDEIIDDMLSYISKGEDAHVEIDPHIEGRQKIILDSIKGAKSFLLIAHIIYVCVKIYRVVTFGDNIDYDVIKMYKKTGVNLDLNLNLNQRLMTTALILAIQLNI